MKQALEQVKASLVSHPEAAETEQQKECPLDDPRGPSQSFARVDATPDDPRGSCLETVGWNASRMAILRNVLVSDVHFEVQEDGVSIRDDSTTLIQRAAFK